MVVCRKWGTCLVWRRSRNDGMEVTCGCSIGSMTLVGNRSNAGVEARVISISISGSGGMEAEGSSSLGLSSNSSSSSGDGHMLLRSGALVRLVIPIACGISLSPLRQ